MIKGEIDGKRMLESQLYSRDREGRVVIDSIAYFPMGLTIPWLVDPSP